MSHLNKPRAVRESLGLTPTDAGRLLLGVDNHKRAYDIWAKMERDNTVEESLGNSMRQYLRLLLMLSMCRDLNTPGCGKALDKWLDYCQPARTKLLGDPDFTVEQRVRCILDAYDEGESAGRCNARADNPYQRGTAEYIAWSRGETAGYGDLEWDRRNNDDD